MSSGNVLDGLSTALARMPASYATEAVKAFKALAEANGGTMMGRYQLTAKEKKRYVRDTQCTLIMQGVPAGFWVWKETGTKPHTIAVRGRGRTKGAAAKVKVKRRRGKTVGRGKQPALYGAGWDHPVAGPVHHPGTSGRRAWTRTVAEAGPVLRQACNQVLYRAVAKAA